MDDWRIGWMDGWRREWMNEGEDGKIGEWMEKNIDRGENGLKDEMDGGEDGWKREGWMKGKINGEEEDG
jgi:hypothetical protein